MHIPGIHRPLFTRAAARSAPPDLERGAATPAEKAGIDWKTALTVSFGILGVSAIVVPVAVTFGRSHASESSVQGVANLNGSLASSVVPSTTSSARSTATSHSDRLVSTTASLAALTTAVSTTATTAVTTTPTPTVTAKAWHACPADAPVTQPKSGRAPAVDAERLRLVRARGDVLARSLRAQWPVLGAYSGSGQGWWNAANALEALIDHAVHTGTVDELKPLLREVYNRNEHTGFLNESFDDAAWWALAWVKAYDATGEGSYIDAAKRVFADMKTNGWDHAVPEGGMYWQRKETGNLPYKNAITNELFLVLAARLANRTPGDCGPDSYRAWAEKELDYFMDSGMVGPLHRVADGMRESGPVGEHYAYNQGVILGGLVEMARLKNDPKLLDEASAIAAACMERSTEEGVLVDAEDNVVDNYNGNSFKGIFMRYLSELAEATGDPDRKLQAFALRQTDSIWSRSQVAGHAGLKWRGPFDDIDSSSDASALDAFNTAARLAEGQA
jgi:predicted alpha-1,6-mannanase (GH76 family)